MTQDQTINLMLVLTLAALAIFIGVLWYLKRANLALRELQRAREWQSSPPQPDVYVVMRNGRATTLTSASPNGAWSRLVRHLNTRESIADLKAKGYRVTLVKGK